MSFKAVREGPLEYLRSDMLSARHAFSTRLGGVSVGQLQSLNLGIHRGDRPINVLQNWRRFAAAVGFDWKRVVFTRQIHTNVVRAVTAADCGRGLFFPVADGCDALMTDAPGVVLAAFSADCTPILLQDPVCGAVCAVHAGWRGTALGIVQTAVAAMAGAYGSRPEDIRAAIGPCIGLCCFETHQDVPDAMCAALGGDAMAAIVPADGGKFHVDLKKLNAIWLRRAGVGHIDISSACTACEPDRFWSHRRVGDQRGSLAAVITCPGP